MKKLFAIALALMLCVSVLSVAAFAADDTITVHAQVPIDWDAPNVYTWITGQEGSIAWPGTAMKLEGDWWVGEVPATDDNVIINNGSAQTGDTPMDAGKDVWVVVADDLSVTVSYAEPGADAPSTDAPSTDAPTTGTSPETGDMGIAAASMALLAATAGLVATVSKKKEF